MATEIRESWESAAPKDAMAAAVEKGLGPFGDWLRGDRALAARRTPLEKILGLLGRGFASFASAPEAPRRTRVFFGLAVEMASPAGGREGGGCVFILVFGLLPVLWIVYLFALFPWLCIPFLGVPALLVAHHLAARSARERRRKEWRRESLEAANGAGIGAARAIAKRLKEGGDPGETGSFLRGRAKELIHAGVSGAATDTGDGRHPFAGCALLAWDGASEARRIALTVRPVEKPEGRESAIPGAERDPAEDLGRELSETLHVPLKGAALDVSWVLPACSPPEGGEAPDPPALAARRAYEAHGFPAWPSCPSFRAGDRVFVAGPAGNWTAATASEVSGRECYVNVPGAGLQWVDASRLQAVPPPIPLARKAARAVLIAGVVLALLAVMAFTLTLKPKKRTEPLPKDLTPAAPSRLLERLPEPGQTVLVRVRYDDPECVAATVDSVQPPEGVTVRFRAGEDLRQYRLDERSLFEDGVAKGTSARCQDPYGGSTVVVLEREGNDCRVAWPDGTRRKVPLAELRFSFRELLAASPPRPLVRLAEAPPPGTRVLSRHRDTRFAVLGTVVEARDADGKAAFAVKYADGEMETRSLADLYRDGLWPGARVEAACKVEGKLAWLPGRVATRQTWAVRVYCDEGPEGLIQFGAVRVPLGEAK
jgi:hypothetical protein